MRNGIIILSLVPMIWFGAPLLAVDMVLGDGTDPGKHDRHSVHAVTFSSPASVVNFNEVSAYAQYVGTTAEFLEAVSLSASAEANLGAGSAGLDAMFRSVSDRNDSSHFIVLRAHAVTQPLRIDPTTLELTDQAKELLMDERIPPKARLEAFTKSHGLGFVSGGRLHFTCYALLEFQQARNHSKLIAGLGAGYRDPTQAYRLEFEGLQSSCEFRKKLTIEVACAGAIAEPAAILDVVFDALSGVLQGCDPKAPGGNLTGDLSRAFKGALDANLTALQNLGPAGFAVDSEDKDTLYSPYDLFAEYATLKTEVSSYLTNLAIAGDTRTHFAESLVPFRREIYRNLARYNLQISLARPPDPLAPFHIYSDADLTKLQTLVVEKNSELIEFDNMIRKCDRTYVEFRDQLITDIKEVDADCKPPSMLSRDVLEDIRPTITFEDSPEWALATRFVVTSQGGGNTNVHHGDVICAYKYGAKNLSNVYAADKGFLFDRKAIANAGVERGYFMVWLEGAEGVVQGVGLRDRHGADGCYSHTEIGSRALIVDGRRYRWMVPRPQEIGQERTFVRVIEAVENGKRRLGPDGVPDVKHVEFVTFDSLGFIKTGSGDGKAPFTTAPVGCGVDRTAHFVATGASTPRENFYSDATGVGVGSLVRDFVAVDFRRSAAGSFERVIHVDADEAGNFSLEDLRFEKNVWAPVVQTGDIVPTSIDSADVRLSVEYHELAWEPGSVVLRQGSGTFSITGTKKSVLPNGQAISPVESERIEIWALGSDGYVVRELGGLKLEIRDAPGSDDLCQAFVDEIRALRTKFEGQKCTFEEGDCADTNGDGQTDLSDAVYLLNFLFLEGAAPRCGASQ